MNKAGKAGRMVLAFTAAIVALGCSPVLAAQESASSAAQAPLAMVSARVWLNKALDAKKAKADDPVTLKLLDDAKISGARVLPRNTVLLGHVDRVQASENKGDSVMQVTFDKAQLKDGQLIPVKVTIMRILPPPGYSNPGGGSLTPDLLSPSSTTGAGAAMNPGSAGPPAGSSVQRGEINQTTEMRAESEWKSKAMSKRAVQEHSPQKAGMLTFRVAPRCRLPLWKFHRHRNEVAGLEKKGLLQWLCPLPPIRLNLFSAYGFPRPSCQIGEYVALRGNTFALACVPT